MRERERERERKKNERKTRDVHLANKQHSSVKSGEIVMIITKKTIMINTLNERSQEDRGNKTGFTERKQVVHREKFEREAMIEGGKRKKNHESI